MKNINISLSILLCFSLFLLMGCKEDDDVGGKVPYEFSIVYAIGENMLADINLDETIGPEIWGSVRAPEGLAKVTFVAVRASGEDVVKEVTSFEDPTFYEFKVRPLYTDDMESFKVTATNTEGKTVENAIAVSAMGGESGPAIAVPEDTVRANIGIDLTPLIAGTIGSHWGVKSVTYYLLKGEEEEAFGDPVTDFEDSITYDFSVQPDYTLDLTGFRIVAADSRGVESDDTVFIKVIDAGYAPAITFDQESIEADMIAAPPIAPEVSGNIVSDEGLVSVSYYLAYDGGEDEQFGETVTTFANPNDFDFSVDPPYGFGVTGVKVVAIDALGQESSATVAATVNAEDTELQVWNNIVSNAQGNRNDAGVKTAISSRDGSTYTLSAGTDAAVSETIDFITADSGGDNELDLFSPSHDSWLEGNYFEDEDDAPVIWPVLNQTKMVLLEGKDEAFFNSATSADIRALPIGDDFETRMELEPDQIGSVVLFQTAQGKKGLLLYKNSDQAAGKTDQFTFDIKVIK